MTGRIVFGLSAVLYAVVTLMWHGSDMWEHLRWMPAPASTIAAWCLAIAQIVGGIGILLPRTTRTASVVLGGVYLIFSLQNVPGMFAAPTNPVLYINFFEQFSIVCGAIVLFAQTDVPLARLALGLCAFSFAWAQVVYFQFTAGLVPKWIPPNQAFWTILTTIAFALAGIAMLVNVRARLATRLMALMIALFGVLVWVPHIAAQPAALANWSEFGLNFLIAGAAWLVADGE